MSTIHSKCGFALVALSRLISKWMDSRTVKDTHNSKITTDWRQKPPKPLSSGETTGHIRMATIPAPFLDFPSLLQLLTEIHNVVPADGTVIDHNIPGPEGYCIPLQREGGDAFSCDISADGPHSHCDCSYFSGHKHHQRGLDYDVPLTYLI